MMRDEVRKEIESDACILEQSNPQVRPACNFTHKASASKRAGYTD